MLFSPDPEFTTLLGRPVAVFGGGVSGLAATALIERLGGGATLFDEKGGEGRAMEVTAAKLSQFGLVVVSPGFRVEHPWLKLAEREGVPCWGELDFAARLWRGKVLAVTGTNGKTTLTEFLTHALRSIGINAYATGNIGHSFCSLVDTLEGGDAAAWAVCEVSSFQAEILRHYRADAVLWTNFAEDHLERHPGMEAYFAAKENLLNCLRPGAAVYYGTSVRRYADQNGRRISVGVPVETEGLAADPTIVDTVFAGYPQRENYVLAEAWWRGMGFPVEALQSAAKSFRLGRHRLAQVGASGGVTWWNDSKATNFHAVEAALGRFERPVVLIAGGKGKGGDLAGFVRRIAPRVKHAYLIGETKGVLASFCAAYHVSHTVCATLGEAVDGAGKTAAEGEHVLLSPGFASFDMFRGYDDRGNQFEQLVRARFVTVATPANLT